MKLQQSQQLSNNSLISSTQPYNSKVLGVKLHPNYIVGLIDGEGCFNISITKNPRMSAGYNVRGPT